MTCAGELLFISGQIPPESGRFINCDIAGKTKVVMERIGAVLKKYGPDYSKLVKCSVFVTDIRDYGKVSEVYATFFKGNYPAR